MLPVGRRAWVVAIVWIVATVAVMSVDRRVAEWVARVHPLNKHGLTARIVRLPGNYLFVLGVALLTVLSRRGRRAAVPLVLSGPAVGMLYLGLKWMIGRRRPVVVIAPFVFHPFLNGPRGLFFSVSGLSFPSGDAMMAFAAAGCLAFALSEWSAVCFLWATLVAAERVLENAHYVSDVTAGAGLGLLCALVLTRLSRRLISEPAAIEMAQPAHAADDGFR